VTTDDQVAVRTIGVDTDDAQDARATGTIVRTLVDDRVASRIAAKDATLWGTAAEDEAAVRLGWVDLYETSRPLLAEIEALQAELRGEGLDRIVLAGMGGSSLAPEVITRTAGVDLVVLDTTDPGRVARALRTDLDRTVVVVSSKSGSTVETDSQRRAFEAAFTAAEIEPGPRMVAVTDPGSELAEHARAHGYRRVFLADPNVGGRYSALTAFGLVPSGLAGADIASLLDEAADAAPAVYADDPANPALVLAAVIAGRQDPSGRLDAGARDKAVIAEHDAGLRSFGAWAEQLLAESTGKEGRGVLPVDVGTVDAAGWRDADTDATLVALGTPVDDHGPQAATSGPLGAQFLLWEVATAIVGRLVGINPFDQPNVEEAKRATRELLDPEGGVEQGAGTPAGAVSVLTAPSGAHVESPFEAIDALADAVPESGYLAVLAYLDSDENSQAELLRTVLAGRLGPRQVTFGWGPRYLHSTGQYHKGGHPNGAFLVLSGTSAEACSVPGRPYDFGQLIAAQARGDVAVLTEKGFPVLHLHLGDRAAGLAAVLDAARGPAT